MGGGGGGKKTKHIHARVNAKKKNSYTEEDKKIHAERKSNCEFKSGSHSENSWSLTPGRLLLISKDI